MIQARPEAFRERDDYVFRPYIFPLPLTTN